MSKLALRTPQGYALRKDLETLLAGIEKATADFKSLTGDKLNALSEEYQELQEKKDALEKDLKEKERIAELDLNLRIKANKKDAVEKLSKELSLVVISKEEWEDTKFKLSSTEEAIQKAVEEQKQKGIKAKEAACSAITSRAEVEKAKIEASNETLKEKVIWLEQRLADTNEMLRVVQDNAVKIAEAGNKSFNVTSHEKK